MLAPFEPGLYLLHYRTQRVPFWAEPLTDHILAKGGDAPHERWITLKPHGDDSDAYVRVKIRVNPEGHGHVIAGPKDLRGLRLTRLATAEELKTRARERAAKRRERAAKEQAEQEAAARADPEGAKERAEREAEVQKQLAEVQRRALTHAAALTGDESYQKVTDEEHAKRVRELAAQAALRAAPEGDEKLAEGGAKLAAAQHQRAAAHALNKLVRGVIQNLAVDDELKNLVLADDDAVEAAELGPVASSGSRGYAFSPEEAAAAWGYTKDDAKLEAERLAESTARAQHPGDEVAVQDALERRAKLQKVHAYAAEARGALQGEARPEATVAPKTLQERAQAARELLKAHREMKRLQRELRRVQLGEDPEVTLAEQRALEAASRDPKGSPWRVAYEEVAPDFAAELERQIEDAKAEDLTRSFLAAVDGDEAADMDAATLRHAMRGPHATGGYAHLNNVALAALAHDPLDRTVLDTLGLEAGAKLTAHALRRALDPEALERLKTALAEHHDRETKEAMSAALAAADAARAEAQAMDIPELSTATDAAVVTHLLKEKRARLREAHQALGTALGALEAGAALNFALRNAPEETLAVNLGEVAPDRAALNLRALGLQSGDYELMRSGSDVWVHLNRQGMDRLTPAAPPEEVAAAKRLAAVKRGELDEPDWLPAGFARYSAAAFDAEPPVPEAYAVNPTLSQASDLHAAVGEVIASRLAEGWSPGEVARLLNKREYVAAFVPPERMDAFTAALKEHLPTVAATTERRASDGSTVARTVFMDYVRLKERAAAGRVSVPPPLEPEVAAGMGREAFNRYEEARAEALAQNAHVDAYERLGALANDWLKANRPGAVGFDDQQLEDTPEARRALHQTLLEDPRRSVALKAVGDLNHRDQRALRSYFATELRGLSAEQLAAADRDAKRAAAEWERRNPEPPKWGGAFGVDPNASVTLAFGPALADEKVRVLRSMNLTGEHYRENPDGSVTLTDAGKAALRPPAKRYQMLAGQGPSYAIRGLEALSAEWIRYQQAKAAFVSEAAGTENLRDWADFVELAGGTQRAYEAIQDHMRGELAKRFSDAYGRMTGEALRLGVGRNRGGDALLAMSDPELYDKLQQQRASEMDQGRARAGGRYAFMGGAGAVISQYLEAQEKKKAAANQVQTLFGGFGGADPGAREAPVPGLESHTLPEGVVNRLRQLNAHLTRNLDPNARPAQLIKDQTMGKGTKYQKQQTAIRSILEGKKQLLALSVGSGKTATALGAFTELHARGEARKGIFAVPSIVRDQFPEEMSVMLEPGRYNWYADQGTFEDRLEAYRHPETHMVAVTHQTFRDDLLRLMSEHHGAPDPESFLGAFRAASPERRKTLMREALDAHGIALDYLAIDEGHDFLNRAGKQESAMAAIGDTAMALAKYGAYFTGSAIKNDMSEALDWLSKLHPERFADPDALRRRYATDAFASREGFKRLSERYVYHDAVPNHTRKQVVWGAEGGTGAASPSGHRLIGLSDVQREQLALVEAAYERARRAARRGEVDVEALKVLAPGSFAGADKSEHEALARRLGTALGTLKHAAVGRVINEAPSEHNAKVQHVLSLAAARRGKGGVVFATSLASVRQLAEALSAQGHKVATLTGADNARQKAAVRRAFDAKEVDIIVASDAGSTGANLQKRGEYLVQYDVPLTYKTLEQRSGRIDRLGQNKAIEIHHLMVDHDYDRDNYQRVVNKERLGDLLKGPWEVMDDTGVAKYLKLAQTEAGVSTPPEQQLVTDLFGNLVPASAQHQSEAPDEARGPDPAQGGLF